MQVSDWLKPGIFRLCEHEYVCLMVCVHRKLFLGMLGQFPAMHVAGWVWPVPWHWACICIA